MALHVLVLNAAGSARARKRTLDALQAQSVEVQVHVSPVDLVTLDGEYVAMVLAGTVLDATACERAVWFLATHPAVHGVTGAAAAGDGVPTAVPLQSGIQFVLARRASAAQVGAASDALHGSAAIAMLIGLRRASGRGAGWMIEPVIREVAEQAVLAPLEADARAALAALALEESALIDMSAHGLSNWPLQSLASVSAPDLTHRRVTARGMRILVLVQGFPMGGYTAFNADLLPRLSRVGHTITTCMTEWWRSDWRLDDVRTASADIHQPFATVPPMAMPAYVDWLITSRGVDVVLLSHSQVGLHLLPYLRARHPDVAFVDYVHTDWFEAAMYGSYAEMAVRWEGQLDAQLATSDALVAHLVTRGCDAAAVHAAHIGIDTTQWTHTGPRHPAIRASLGATPGTVVLLYSGRISPEKRPHLAVDVLAALRGEGHDAMLVIAGDGQLFKETHARAERAGMGAHCKFLGELDEQTLRHVYAACDVFIAPSEIEGVARSLYEAMAMGCVPVVSDVGGQRELVVPGTGSVVHAVRDDAALYVDGVRPWLDARARAMASAAARAHIVAHFDTRTTVTRVCAALELARVRRRARQEVLPAAMAEELVVMSIEVMRRHVLRALLQRS